MGGGIPSTSMGCVLRARDRQLKMSLIDAVGRACFSAREDTCLPRPPLFTPMPEQKF